MVTERNGPSQGLYFIFHALTLPFQYLCNSSRAILTSSQSGIVRTTSLTNFLTPVLVQLSVNDSLVPPGAIRFGSANSNGQQIGDSMPKAPAPH